MLRNDVVQIEGVVRTLIGSFGRDCRLECIRKCAVEIGGATLEERIPKKGGGAE